MLLVMSFGRLYSLVSVAAMIVINLYIRVLLIKQDPIDKGQTTYPPLVFLQLCIS